MTAGWVSCGSSFIEADVVRWSEVAWQKPRWGSKSKAVHTGERLVIAEVLRIEGEWLVLLVRDGKVMNEKSGWKVPTMAAGMEVRRKRSTVEKGRPERLLWSDESARALLVSESRGGDNPPPSGS